MGISEADFHAMRERTERARGRHVTDPGTHEKLVELKRAVEVEMDLHDELESWCRSNGHLYIHARTDRKSTIAVGHPDFTIFMPDRAVCFLELKRRGGKATIEQLAKVRHARKLGFVAEVVDNMADVMEAVERAKKLAKPLKNTG